MTKRQQKRRDIRRKGAASTLGVGGAVAAAEHHAKSARVSPGRVTPPRSVPDAVVRPPYARAPDALEPEFAPGSFVPRMRAAGRAAAEVLRIVGERVGPGVTTEELDALAFDTYLELGGYPSTLGYKGYRKSLCTSVNEIICHGIPDDRALVEGDIVNCDVTIFLEGVHGDTSATFAVGSVSDERARLVAVTRQCLWRGIRAVRPGVPMHDIGRAIQTHAEAHNFSVVRNFVGHGIGEVFHCAPSVPHYYDRDANDIMMPGDTFTIEPMINAGSWEVGKIWRDRWTAPTADGSDSAQFEHTLLVTNEGVEVLTLGHDETPDYG